MNQAADYRKHAEECRQLASTASTEAERRTLLEMAAMWEKLARDREAAAKLRGN